MHKLIQTYLDTLYRPLQPNIHGSLFAQNNEIYGELNYYSVLKLLEKLNLTKEDRFLDIGSGLGKLVFQVFLTTEIQACIGIEINLKRHNIAQNVQTLFESQLKNSLPANRELTFMHGNFLELDDASLHQVTLAYLCSTVFSELLLKQMAEKINHLKKIHTVISMRKLPALKHFQLRKKIFLHGSWDMTACYIYKRKTKIESLDEKNHR